MAILHPGDVIATYPTVDTLAAGLPLFLPYRACTVLQFDSGGFGKFPPREADKAGVLSAMTGLNVPEPFRTNEFGKMGWPLRAQLNRTVCLWGAHSLVRVTIETQYAEGTGPGSSVNAPDTSETPAWAVNTTLSRSVTSGTPPGTFGYLGGGVPWHVDLTVTAVPDADGCDQHARVTATLTDTNYDFLAGTPATQTQEQSCHDFKLALGLTFFWTGVHFNPGDPVGLVRSMSLIVRGSTTYT